MAKHNDSSFPPSANAITHGGTVNTSAVIDEGTGLRRLDHGRFADPTMIFGPHRINGCTIIRTFQPGAIAVEAVSRAGENGFSTLAVLDRINASGMFAGVVPRLIHGADYCLKITWPGQNPTEASHQYTEDPYAFGSLLGDLDLHLINEGTHRRLSHCLGAQPMVIDGVHGTRFAVWAPHAKRVALIGDFNGWDGRRHPMRPRHGSGVWELFVPRIGAGMRYQYEITAAGVAKPLRKSDPVARATDLPPSHASVVASANPFAWHDDAWMARRKERQHPAKPMAIYEVHAASWRRNDNENGRSLNWHELADQLIPYVVDLGFTHIELLPVMEHPFGGSWGYQPLSQFAPTARLGSPAAFAAFVDRCHTAGIGVILDWVPAHFPADAHGLANFDGGALYEYSDRREGFHPDWNTLIYNYGRSEVCGFLIASALEWVERYHIDGLRVDAVSSMLYRNYSRPPGEWLPNAHGGHENLEAIAFLRELNEVVAQYHPGVMIIAEESTAWPGVSAPSEQGGLGFAYKWNMGWMNDTLRYMTRDPVYRSFHHHDITLATAYAFSERFVLPISHDEVVHGKGSLLQKMPGDLAQKLANLRAYLAFMWTHPGKKLLFMGCEFAQHHEWSHDSALQWELLERMEHQGVHTLVRDLNGLYLNMTALHDSDCQPEGFAWIIGDDDSNSVYAYLRKSTREGDTSMLLVICNMTPVARTGYRVGVPASPLSGVVQWKEVLNTDSSHYGGSNQGNLGIVMTEAVPSHGQPASIVLSLPPLSTIVLQRGQ